MINEKTINDSIFSFFFSFISSSRTNTKKEETLSKVLGYYDIIFTCGVADITDAGIGGIVVG